MLSSGSCLTQRTRVHGQRIRPSSNQPSKGGSSSIALRLQVWSRDDAVYPFSLETGNPKLEILSRPLPTSPCPLLAYPLFHLQLETGNWKLFPGH